jgi:hypothetical protein
MKLHSVTEMGPVAGVCCRQSRLRGAVGALILSAILVGAIFLGRHVGAPWFVWGGCAVVAGLFVPIVIRDALAKFRSTNWVLRVDPDGLWINLRSFQQRSAAEAATVVQVNYEEIDHAHWHIDTWTTPTSNSRSLQTWTTPTSTGRSVQWKLESLDLHLVSDDTRDLALALAEGHASSKDASPSVTVPAPGAIRIAWRGHGLGHDVVPALGQVLAEMSERVTVTDTTRTDRPDWRRLSEAELDEQIEHLVRWGDEGGAIVLLMRRRGYSSTEAHKFVAELATRA